MPKFDLTKFVTMKKSDHTLEITEINILSRCFGKNFVKAIFYQWVDLTKYFFGESKSLIFPHCESSFENSFLSKTVISFLVEIKFFSCYHLFCLYGSKVEGLWTSISNVEEVFNASHVSKVSQNVAINPDTKFSNMKSTVRRL